MGRKRGLYTCLFLYLCIRVNCFTKFGTSCITLPSSVSCFYYFVQFNYNFLFLITFFYVRLKILRITLFTIFLLLKWPITVGSVYGLSNHRLFTESVLRALSVHMSVWVLQYPQKHTTPYCQEILYLGLG